MNPSKKTVIIYLLILIGAPLIIGLRSGDTAMWVSFTFLLTAPIAYGLGHESGYDRHKHEQQEKQELDR